MTEPYNRVRVFGRRMREQRAIWERHHGPIPDGYYIHHKNGDKKDNRIENLELVDPLTHNRLHSGCKLIDGVWWKKCGKCGELKQIDTDFYFTLGHVRSMCKKCFYNDCNERRKEWRKCLRKDVSTS